MSKVELKPLDVEEVKSLPFGNDTLVKLFSSESIMPFKWIASRSLMQYRMIAPLNQMVLRLRMICNFDEGLENNDREKKDNYPTEVKV